MFAVKHRATIQCEWESADKRRGCVRTEYLDEDSEKRSLEEFNQFAKAHFEEMGWKIFGGTRCPHCHRCEKDGEVPYQDR